MARILFKGAQYNVLQSETLAVPQYGTEVTTSVSDTEFIFRFKGTETSGFGVEPTMDGKQLSYILTGFHNPLGSYFDVPVGDIGGKQLHLSVSVHGVQPDVPNDNIARLVTITFLLEV